MVDSKENYKFDLGVEGLISSVNYTLSHKNKRNNQQPKNSGLLHKFSLSVS